MLLTLDIHNSCYVHHLEGVLQQKSQKRPISEKRSVFPLFPVRLVNLAQCNITFQKVYTGYVCGRGDGDAIIERRKRWYSNNAVSNEDNRLFLSSAFRVKKMRTRCSSQSTPLFRTLSSIITSLRSPLRHFLSYHPYKF